MRRAAASVIALALLLTGGGIAQGADTPPKPGAPCPKAGMIWEDRGMVFKCVKKKKKLVWQLISTTGGGGTGGGTGGGSSPVDQPVPTNGKWIVEAGFPDDMPPRGWRGEPSWFISNWDVPTAQRIGPACPQYPLTHLATDLAPLDSITPQGFMQPGAHNIPVPHMYYNTGDPTSVTKDPNGVAYVSEVVNVYAPGDMILRGLVKQNVNRNGAKFVEYMISFSVCDNLWFTTAHIDEVNPELLAAAQKSPLTSNVCKEGGQQQDTQDCTYEYLRHPIKAGTLIGKASGRAHGFDFGFTDTKQPVTGKMDPGAFSPRWAAGVCHLNYYAPAMRAQLEAKVVGDNGCGQLVSDVPATASGVWLAVGKRMEAQREDLHIALAKHWSVKGTLVMSIGTMTNIPGLPSGRYELKPTTSGNNRAFALVKSGEIACYDTLIATRGMTVGPTVYVTMKTGDVEQLQIVGTTGACPTNPTAMPAGAVTFERRNTLK